MEAFLGGVIVIAILLLAGFIAYLVLKGLWRALVSVKNNLPSFLEKVFVSLGASLVAGVVGAVALGADLKLAGGVGLVGAIVGAFLTQSS